MPPQILIHSTEPQPRWFSVLTCPHPLIRNGRKSRAPNACSNVIIRKDGIVYNFWRRIPSRLHRNAAVMTARGGRYFFTGGKLSLLWFDETVESDYFLLGSTSLFQQHHLLGLYELPSLYLVEVDSGCNRYPQIIPGVPLNDLFSCSLLGIQQSFHSPA